MKRSLAVVAVLLLLIAGSMGCISGEEKVLNVYHAGSLSIPFDEMEARFEDEHPDVDVRMQGDGSVATVKKVTEQGKAPDVVAVADHSLIPDLMYEEYADWTVRFARNRMVIAHTSQSNHRDEITSDNWYQILNREDVKFGFSNPNDDPCGYRSQMVSLLAEDHYGNEHIFDGLIENNTAIGADGYNISVPSDIDFDSDKVMVRSAEVELMSALEAGEIDYLFIYQSVAEQHEGVGYTNLPEQIDMSSVQHADKYDNVTLTRSSGEEVQGKPIVYGITIPETVKNRNLAIQFVKMLIQDVGRDVMDSNGQPPLDPPQTDDKEAVPGELRSLVEERSEVR